MVRAIHVRNQVYHDCRGRWRDGNFPHGRRRRWKLHGAQNEIVTRKKSAWGRFGKTAVRAATSQLNVPNSALVGTGKDGAERRWSTPEDGKGGQRIRRLSNGHCGRAIYRLFGRSRFRTKPKAPARNQKGQVRANKRKPWWPGKYQ